MLKRFLGHTLILKSEQHLIFISLLAKAKPSKGRITRSFFFFLLSLKPENFGDLVEFKCKR